MQLGKGTSTASNPMAHARTSVDGGDAEQESQHAALSSPSLGLEGMMSCPQDVQIPHPISLSI